MAHYYLPFAIQSRPVIHTVILSTQTDEDLVEEIPKELIIGFFVKTELAYILEINGKLLYEKKKNLVNEKPFMSCCVHTPGYPAHSSRIGVDCFFSPMRSYFCLLVAAFNPCHGNDPRRKYMKT